MVAHREQQWTKKEGTKHQGRTQQHEPKTLDPNHDRS